MNNLLSHVFETLADGVLVMDPQGRILEVNGAAEAMTGFSREALLGGPCRMLNCSGCRRFEKGEAEAHCSLFSADGEKVVRCSITGKDGVAVPVLKRARVIRDASGVVMGAVEVLTDMRQLQALENRVASLADEVCDRQMSHGIEGESVQVRQLLSFVTSVASSSAPVLIQGESGTGKELVAHAIHDESFGAGAPFIKVNCAALNENLLESELFGHVKGSFTGASKDRVGRFEAAHGGTLFLDEIGDLPASIQVKLLRVLEEKVIERVGDHTPVPVDVRIITATHRDLSALVAAGAFREDLFFRINVIPVFIAPLRERGDDILLLANRFLSRFALRDGKTIPGISADAASMLMAYPWPGNIRELQNAMEYAMVLAHDEVVEAMHLPPRLGANSIQEPLTGRREKILKALEASGGAKGDAAQRLGVSRVTLWKWMKQEGLA